MAEETAMGELGIDVSPWGLDDFGVAKILDKIAVVRAERAPLAKARPITWVSFERQRPAIFGWMAG